MTYCFKCEDGHRWTQGSRTGTLCAEVDCHRPAVRDYYSERVGFNGLADMKRQREEGTDGLSGRKDQASFFLPTADEYRSPEDPTGQKGLRKWAEEHGPKAENKRPVYPPDLEKTHF